ncbi:hypothetical protein ASPZODRAFT_65290 [Penicilliopsis zonata CBS 506.65]|uniref:Pentatricopeptide repeat-containing protein-mitochondrial domain-containing protein n=1 Tax=Penicilliopsis zonata CBS 506.65 TaxID=1073090 RepID=A0A1L9SIS4_9EURO|nr:hypothetical protein ASPZODRAFT_65290 [Penicilliopsis zonata CBS 506.65]OJJ47098.1 hypothetical protein ASPZODRAFT_65290 [Penicilliopsis zonata CBS 506.65]
MPQKAIVLDGLWCCLCPILNPAFSTRLRNPLFNTPRASNLRIRKPPPTCTKSLSSRCYSTEVTRERQASATEQRSHGLQAPVRGSGKPRFVSGKSQPNAPKAPQKSVPMQSPDAPHHLERRSTAELEEILQDRVAVSPNIVNTTQILRVLIKKRHVRPDVRHYRALILANADSERGSPDAVRKLLSEMEENGIPADSGTLHAALQVLAVHPDYVLRQEIVRTLRDRWVPLSPAGWHFVVAGLIREHQFELALEHLAYMERRDIVIESWLHNILIYNLCDLEEFDEVLNQMRSRTDQNHDISLDLWSYVLEVASEALHHQCTRYVWERVRLGYLHPSHGVCRNVLLLASLKGDPELAASVIDFFVKTGVSLSLEDMEKVVESHLVADDLYSAFQVLCKTQMSGISLEGRAIRPILDYMIRTKTRPDTAWNILKGLKAEKLLVPIDCARVVLKLCEYGALQDPFMVDEGIRLYKDFQRLCPDGADVSIYNTLINMCRRARDPQAGMFVVKEMASLDVAPIGTTFERIILLCLDSGNFESAFKYFKDMLRRRLTLSEEARLEIRGLCLESEDAYALAIASHPQVKGDD